MTHNSELILIITPITLLSPKRIGQARPPHHPDHHAASRTYYPTARPVFPFSKKATLLPCLRLNYKYNLLPTTMTLMMPILMSRVARWHPIRTGILPELFSVPIQQRRRCGIWQWLLYISQSGQCGTSNAASTNSSPLSSWQLSDQWGHFTIWVPADGFLVPFPARHGIDSACSQSCEGVTQG